VCTHTPCGARDFIETVFDGMGHPTMLPGEPAHSRNAPVDATLPQSPEPTDEHRIVVECLLSIDEALEQLVVASGTHPKISADRLFFCAAVTRPCRFEGEDRTVAISEVSEHGLRLLPDSACAVAPLPPAPQCIGCGTDLSIERHDKTVLIALLPGCSIHG
jgi:hypothetical protein